MDNPLTDKQQMKAKTSTLEATVDYIRAFAQVGFTVKDVAAAMCRVSETQTSKVEETKKPKYRFDEFK